MINLDYFLDSCIVAITVVVILESLPYELFIDWLLNGASWGTKKYAYCSLCAGFWAGLIYFSLAQYYGSGIPFWKGAFLTSGLSYTLSGLWERLYSEGRND